MGARSRAGVGGSGGSRGAAGSGRRVTPERPRPVGSSLFRTSRARWSRPRRCPRTSPATPGHKARTQARARTRTQARTSTTARMHLRMHSPQRDGAPEPAGLPAPANRPAAAPWLGALSGRGGRPPKPAARGQAAEALRRLPHCRYHCPAPMPSPPRSRPFAQRRARRHTTGAREPASADTRAYTTATPGPLPRGSSACAPAGTPRPLPPGRQGRASLAASLVCLSHRLSHRLSVCLSHRLCHRLSLALSPPRSLPPSPPPLTSLAWSRLARPARWPRTAAAAGRRGCQEQALHNGGGARCAPARGHRMTVRGSVSRAKEGAER